MLIDFLSKSIMHCCELIMKLDLLFVLSTVFGAAYGLDRARNNALFSAGNYDSSQQIKCIYNNGFKAGHTLFNKIACASARG